MSLYDRLVRRVLHGSPAEPPCPPYHLDLAGAQLDSAARGAARQRRPGRSSTAPPGGPPVAMLDDPPLATPAPPVDVDAPPLDWSKVMGARVNALRAHADRVERPP